MRFSLLFAVFFVSCSLSWGQTQTLSPQVSRKIDSVFAAWNKGNSPGAVVGVVHKGQLVYQKAFGYADVQKRHPLTVQHQFWVASVAKQFTAACVALLAEEGKLHLQDDVRKYLPELPAFKDTVRIEHLLYHTSGLRDGFTLIGLTLKGEKHYTNARVLEMLYRQQELNFSPGTRHEYNNGGYVLLAQLVERVSGQSFAAFAQERIFKPLGMTHSHFYGKISKAIPQLAQGYGVTYKNNQTRYKPVHFKANTVGSSGLVTTLEDLVKWDQNFYRNQMGQKNQALVQLLTTSGRLRNGEPIPYALGLEVDIYKGVPTITHTGSDPGYMAELVRFPEHELSIICLANTNDLYSLTQRLQQIGEWFLPPTGAAASIGQLPQAPSAAPLESLPGIYLNLENLSDARYVTRQGEKLLAATSPKGFQETLKPSSPGVFSNEWLPSRYYAFSGLPETSNISLEYRSWATRQSLEKVDSAQYTPQVLEQFTGTYYSPELKKRFRVTARKGQLRLSLFRLVHLPFLSVAGHRFLFDLQGNNCLEFQVGKDGRLEGFTFSREAVTRLWFVKK
ncbi:serine hydrolase domain-containing protein [Rufibacter aurantiacus]|uniref:serine hydrolase domain-containing protein n=1 Tax=Rufibacter aurantiacus TaxID=2817374 RepID=UPI001B308A91|nr:serine hydrolase domain-containing protein [Rufibacter aurantiacus]